VSSTPPPAAWIGSAARFVPAGIALAGMILLQIEDGGYAPTAWYPVSLLVVIALVTGILASDRAGGRTSKRLWLAVGLFVAYAAWTFGSIAWADVRGDAWDGANRTAFYVTVFVLFAVTPWTERIAAGFLAAFVIATTAVFGVTFAHLTTVQDPENAFLQGRLAEPTGYVNANAAVVLIAFWPALVLASRRELHWLLRGTLLGCAGVLVQLALLPQSRGALVAFPVVAALALLVVPGRIRLVVFSVPVLIVTLIWLGPVLDVYAVGEGDEAFGEALRKAGVGMIWAFVVLVVLGLAAARADRRIEFSENRLRLLRRGAAALTVLVAIAGVVLLLVTVGNPVARAESAWHEFKAGQPLEFGESHLTGALGSNRYDFWRVAASEWRASPVTGIGADNFAASYVRERSPTSGEEPMYPHSLVLMVLAQTGVVGALLLTGFLVLAVVETLRRRHAPTSARALASASLLVAVYFLVHGAVDWFWEFPALGGTAFAFLGMAAALPAAAGQSPTVTDRIAWRDVTAARQPGRGVLLISLVVVAIGLAVSYALPWLAAREIELAEDAWRRDARAAFAHLDRARSLNPLSERADLVAGAIAGRLGDQARMTTSFSRALERNEASWYAELQLGVLAYLDGDLRQGLRHIVAAQLLNPAEPVLADVDARMRAGERISLRELDREFLQRVEYRTS
jgi:O-antigen ligase